MSFKVHVKPGDRAFTADDNETVLQAALRAGYGFPYGCRNGTCGSCKGRVLTGEVNHGSCDVQALSHAEQAAGYTLFCQARPLSDIEVEVREINSAAGIVVKTLPCRVVKIERLAHDVVRVYLKLPAAERMQFLAGQYIDILLRDGRRRSFSIANAPHDDEFIELHIRLIEGGRLTGDIFHTLKEKAILRIQGPLGNFYLRDDSARPIIFVAGGTGFGPVKGIIEHALAEKTPRTLYLYWGVRALRDLYLNELARSWTAQPNFSYTPVLSQPAEEDDWAGRRGYVPNAVLADFPTLTEFDVYASGPPAMVHAAHGAFIRHGLAAEHFYADPFEFAKDTVPVT